MAALFGRPVGLGGGTGLALPSMGPLKSTAAAADWLPSGRSNESILLHIDIRDKREKSLVSESAGRTSDERRERQPDRWLPVLYFSFAHLCLASALGIAVWDPRGIAGFYYHPQLIALVHLVTLGWISGSILGAIYMISPMALRTPLPARVVDRVAFWCFAIGTLGMVSHFWIEETWGMIWAGILVWSAFLIVAVRFLPRLARAPVPAEVRVHFVLAFMNILLAGGMGLAIGADKGVELLSGSSLHHVIAHAHLAAIGWATMMVMASGYRLIPMILPAALAQGRWVWSTAVVVETGVLGLVANLYRGARWSVPFGMLVILGIGIFLSRVVWMLRNRRPAPQALRRPDFGVLHVGYALLCLTLAATLGGAILIAPGAEWKPAAAMVYGSLGLLGFLSQMVVGVASRLVPLYGWLRTFARSDFQIQPPSPHLTPSRPIQVLGFLLWVIGLPLITFGLAQSAATALRIGASLLLAAVLTGLWQQTRVLRTHSSTD